MDDIEARIAEIERNAERNTHYAIPNADMKIQRKHAENELWLIAQLREVKADNARLKAALEYYADDSNADAQGYARGSSVARAALGRE